MTPPVHPRTAQILVGPTAVGKSAVAQWIAEQEGAAVLSADSMLVYRGMDIGTAKPTAEERGSVPYFGIDCVSAGEPFSVGDWLATVRREASAWPASSPLVVAGGTGLYVRALLSGLDAPPSDPAERARWRDLYAREGLPALQRAVEERGCASLLAPGDLDNPRRILRALERSAAGSESRGDWGDPAALSPVVGLSMPRDQLASRILRRVEIMFDQGLVDEALAIRAAATAATDAPDGDSTSSQAIGYAEALAYADGSLSRAEAVERIAARTRQLAKRQYTWFRHQLNVVWVDVSDGESPDAVGPRVLEAWSHHDPTPVQL